MQAKCHGKARSPDVKCKKEKKGVDFRFSQGCEHAAEEDLRLARDPGTDDEGRSTTVT